MCLPTGWKRNLHTPLIPLFICHHGAIFHYLADVDSKRIEDEAMLRLGKLSGKTRKTIGIRLNSTKFCPIRKYSQTRIEDFKPANGNTPSYTRTRQAKYPNLDEFLCHDLNVGCSRQLKAAKQLSNLVSFA